MNNATQGIFTPKKYEIYHKNKNALKSKNLSTPRIPREDKPKNIKYINEWHKQCYEGIHTKQDEIFFSKDELVPIFARFCLHKAKQKSNFFLKHIVFYNNLLYLILVYLT
ncbi:hypothetical protein [Helicobacter sp. T3_23-1059]